ncbi:glycine-rich protein [Streptomyces vinaceus]|uniref:glycine-rich protein n=1 Tax=Streptomyces vinaceus TaxID=1960 RepID=UPI00380CB5FC
MRRSVVPAVASAFAAAITLSSPTMAQAGDPVPGAVVFNNGNGNMSIFGNDNNTAGRDNLVGSGQTAGSGHTIGGPLPVSNCTDTTCDFGYLGVVQTFIVPSGVTALNVTTIGAAGGSVPGMTGGRAAEVHTPALRVTPGQTLYVYVGGNPIIDDGCTPGAPCVGGFNGGGDSGIASGGGGASDIRTAPGALGSRIVVAGGGGGAGFPCPIGGAGGDAGMPGTASGCGQAGGGGAGTQTAGGAGGTAVTPSYEGQPGVLGTGGQGQGGGGGGGGLYGGGSGGTLPDGSGGGGGGGGSSLLPPGSTVRPATAPAGSIRISW